MSRQSDVDWALQRSFEVISPGKGDILTITGQVPVEAFFDGSRLVIGSRAPILIANLDFVVHDSWDVCLTINYGDKPIPIVMDISGRLASTLRRIRSLPEDMHLNSGAPMPPWPHMPSLSFCVAPPPEIIEEYSSGFSLPDYMRRYLIPFLYQQSYFEKNQCWPWENYSHGYKGILEWQLENQFIK